MASKTPEKYCPKPKTGSVPLYQFDRHKLELWKNFMHMQGSIWNGIETLFSKIFLTVPKLIR